MPSTGIDIDNNVALSTPHHASSKHFGKVYFPLLSDHLPRNVLQVQSFGHVGNIYRYTRIVNHKGYSRTITKGLG